DRWHIWQKWKWLCRRHTQRTELSGLNVGQRGRRNVKHYLHLTGEKIGHRWRRALVRDVRQVHASHELEQFSSDMLRAADAGRGHVQLAGIGLGIGDELGNGFCRYRGVDLHDQRDALDPPDRRDVATKSKLSFS